MRQRQNLRLRTDTKTFLTGQDFEQVYQSGERKKFHSENIFKLCL